MYSQFKDKGIDDVYCVSVNDAQNECWARDLGIKNVKMIPDERYDTFTRSLGMLVNKPKQGLMR